MSELRPFIFVWIGLLVLLGLTVTASFMLTGAMSLTTGLVIASAKAALVFWFFMHLKGEGGLIRLAAIGGAAWVLILLMLVLADVLTRDVVA